MLCIFRVLPYSGFGMSIMTCGQMFVHVLMKQKMGIKGSEYFCILKVFVCLYFCVW
jgi:hypothetical protein